MKHQYNRISKRMGRFESHLAHALASIITSSFSIIHLIRSYLLCFGVAVAVIAFGKSRAVEPSTYVFVIFFFKRWYFRMSNLPDYVMAGVILVYGSSVVVVCLHYLICGQFVLGLIAWSKIIWIIEMFDELHLDTTLYNKLNLCFF